MWREAVIALVFSAALSAPVLSDSAPTAMDHAEHTKAKVIRDPTLSADGMGRMEYTLGQSIFERIWVSAPASTEAADGLGPLFNARSCVACHPGGARALGLMDAQGLVPSLLVRLGLKSGGPDPVYGGQLQTETVAGVPAEGRVALDFDSHDVTLADGTKVSLQRPRPRLSDLGYDSLDVDTILDQCNVVGHLSRKFDLAAQRPSTTRGSAPAEEEPGHLPQGVEAEATRHDRIALEMDAEEPEVRVDVELGANLAAAVAAASVVDLGDTVEHEHGRKRQLRVSGAEQFAAPAGEQLLVVI